MIFFPCWRTGSCWKSFYLSPATTRPWKRLITGDEVSHPLAESSEEETGEHKPALGDLFAYYKIKLFLLSALPVKEKGQAPSEIAAWKGPWFSLPARYCKSKRRNLQTSRCNFCVSLCTYGEASKKSYTHIHTYPE